MRFVNKENLPVGTNFSFGIGSFFFQITSAVPITLEEQILNLSEALRNIPGLSNLHIEADLDAPPALLEGTHPLRFLNFSFHIDLSSDHNFRGSDTRYSLWTQSEYDTPVTLVFPLTTSADPSTGIVKVRGYIRKYLRSNFELEVIGPSPFHADFFVIPTNFFGVEIEKQSGYDRVQVFVDKLKFLDIKDQIFEELRSELNLFYMMREIEASRVKKWSNIEEKNLLVAGQSAKWFILNDHIAEVMEQLIEFESDSVLLPHLINDRFEDTYNPPREYLREYNDNARRNFRNYPIASVKSLLDFAVSKRSNFWQNLTAYVNTFINVVLAGAVTYILFNIGVH